MSNIGSTYYQVGKGINQLLGFKFKESSSWFSETLRFSSPRVGLIMVGPELFSKKLQINQHNRHAKSNSIMRLAVLFHEARHSDGSGLDLAFSHALCPKGHNYYNSNACDKYKNGPYAVSAVMLKEMLKNCHTCNDVEKEKLKAQILNSKSRIITDYDLKLDFNERELLELKVKLISNKSKLSSSDSLIFKEMYTKKLNIIEEKIDILEERRDKKVNILTKYINPKPEGKRSR